MKYLNTKFWDRPLVTNHRKKQNRLEIEIQIMWKKSKWTYIVKALILRRVKIYLFTPAMDIQEESLKEF